MKRSLPNLDEQLDAISSIDSILSLAKKFVWMAGVAFGLLLLGLQLQKISAGTVIRNLDRNLLVEIALTLLLNAWIWAQPIEFAMTRKVYIIDPRKGKVPIGMVIVLPILVATGFALFLTYRNDIYLSWALAAYLVANVATWKVICSLSKEFQRSSADAYAAHRAFWRVEQVRYYAETYGRGRWQYIRFWVLFAIVLLFLAVAHSSGLRSSAASLVHSLVREVPPEQIAAIIPALTLVLFILVSEIWSWGMRLRTRHALGVIDELRKEYEILPRKPSALLLARDGTS
jgi:hypothetical protein